jgi:hypothetical protein
MSGPAARVVNEALVGHCAVAKLSGVLLVKIWHGGGQDLELIRAAILTHFLLVLPHTTWRTGGSVGGQICKP